MCHFVVTSLHNQTLSYVSCYVIEQLLVKEVQLCFINLISSWFCSVFLLVLVLTVNMGDRAQRGC